MLLQPKNWAVFQHYKDRCPPWIKLHRDLLNDRSYMRLPIASKAIAPMLWLLASESKDGTFDGSIDELVFRLHITEKEYKEGIKPLIDKGFFLSDSNVLATSKQLATSETETETETERETETKKERETEPPLGVSQEVWVSFVKQRKAKKAQVTELVIKGIQKEADKAGWSLEMALNEVVIRNWQSFKAEWVKDKVSNAERLSNTMSDLTRGLTAPKKPFWKTEGVKNVKLL